MTVRRAVQRAIGLMFLTLFAACLSAAPAFAETRFALVIGVSDYGGKAALPNALNDAKLIADKLHQAGFLDENLRLLPNPTKGQIRDALDQLYLKAQGTPDAFVMIYYAGHAAQVDGVNYLIPRGTDLIGNAVTAGDYIDQAFDAQVLVNKFNRSRVRQLLVVLDACRDGGFGGEPGLGELTGGVGGPDWMIAFAASPGQTAADGKGTNGPYALALADALVTPDITLTTAFERVAQRIRSNATLGGQQPYAKGSLGVQLTITPVTTGDISSLARTINRGGGRTVANDESRASGGALGADRIARGDDAAVILKDYLATRTLKDLRQAADGGDRDALYLLGSAAWDGSLGVPKNVKDAIAMMRLATALGSPRAAGALGYYYCCDADGPKNEAEGFEWLLVGAKLNSRNAMRNLAILYRDGKGVAKNTDTAVKWWLRSAELGNAEAYQDLGYFYNLAIYGHFNPALARDYFQKAVDNGDSYSYLRLASGYRYGLLPDGSDKNLSKAISLYIQGGNAGCSECWEELGTLYDSEDLGQPDLTAALSAYIKGGEAGRGGSYLFASQLLGRTSPIQNLTSSFAMAEKAAALGSVEARGKMAKALADGAGVAADPKRAAPILREMVALDKSSDPDKRHAIYAPNYWGFAQSLGTLIEKNLVPPAYPEELKDLRDRYGYPTGSMKRFTVPIQCGNQKTPFYVYVMDWSRPNDETSVQSQAEWLQNQRGCTFPTDVLDSFTKLKRIARENKVSFQDLAVYALGEAQKQNAKPAAATGAETKTTAP